MAILRKKSSLLAINMAPLIDMVFLLLIFFLVATRFMEQERELDMTLPTASEARPLTATPRELFVNIDQQGRFFVDGRFRLEEELEHVMRQAAANNPLTQTVVIRADRHADWQSVATAINVCKKVGIANYAAMMADE
jgi:biopolymer transport protein ExbD